MASFPREHNTLYFDALIRTQKKESVLAFIMATYYAKKNNNNDSTVKDDIYKRLKYAYGLFRDNVRGYDNGIGSYGGTDSQFSSQYTLGLEMGIWKNSKLDLNDLALKVATNEITITDYFDVVLLNYIQPVNGKIVHPLYQIFKYLKNHNTRSISKNEIVDALRLSIEEAPVEAINSLYNLIIGTSYFIESNNTLIVSDKYTVDELLSKCNKKYLDNDGYSRAKNELENDDEKYIEYLISKNESEPSEEELESEIESENQIEDRKYKFKQWLKNSNRFSDNSVRNYSYYINYIKKHGYTDYDLYKISDIAIIDELLYKFNNYENYKSWNVKNRYTPSNALSVYKEFLIEEFENKNNSHYVISIKDYSTVHKLYFDKYGYMYWREGKNRKYNIGDVIYLYFSEDNGQEITRIKKKAIVTEINVPIQRIKMEKYYENVNIEEAPTDGYFIKVKLISETDSKDLLFRNLKNKYNFTVPELGSSLIENKDLIEYIEKAFENNVDVVEDEKIIVDDVNRVHGGFNKIYYGVPGSGKSHKVDEDFKEKEFVKERTTFHPEYTNSDFVGQIIPVVNDNNKVDYVFHPGAFTIQLEYALRHKDEKVCLIIEEINRGNASAIFGDIFQLLDRYENGRSKYEIYNGPILDYLKKQGLKLEKVYIPSNMWIVATMNTSDQNVFTLDTAFKRRWKMEYIKNIFANNPESDMLRNKVILNSEKYPNVTWEKFVKKINNHIIADTSGINGEDKQLGMYFVSIEEINNPKEFGEKILSYLWEDVAKINSSYWFGSISSYDELLDAYNNNFLDVFNSIFDEDIVVTDDITIKSIGE